jgi:hypothetical protein
MGKKNPWGHHGNLLAQFVTSYVEHLKTIWNLGNKHGKLFTISQPTHPPLSPTLSWSCFRHRYLKKNKSLGLFQLILIDALIGITFLRVFLLKKVLLFLAKWIGDGREGRGRGDDAFLLWIPPSLLGVPLVSQLYSLSGTQWTHRTIVIELL